MLRKILQDSMSAEYPRGLKATIDQKRFLDLQQTASTHRDIFLINCYDKAQVGFELTTPRNKQSLSKTQALCDHGYLDLTDLTKFSSKFSIFSSLPLTVIGTVVLTRPSLCSKSAIFREVWHIVNLQPCPCPFEALIPHIRAFN